jgi:hypothetical protein
VTGAEHYREAELFLQDTVIDEHAPFDTCSEAIAYAQVHATLALAAATAEGRSLDWGEVLA